MLRIQSMESRDEFGKFFLIFYIMSARSDFIERLDPAGHDIHGTIGINEIYDILESLDLIRLLVVNDTVTFSLIDYWLLGAGNKFIDLTSLNRKERLVNLVGTNLGSSFDIVSQTSNSTTVLLKINTWDVVRWVKMNANLLRRTLWAHNCDEARRW